MKKLIRPILDSVQNLKTRLDFQAYVLDNQKSILTFFVLSTLIFFSIFLKNCFSKKIIRLGEHFLLLLIPSLYSQPRWRRSLRRARRQMRVTIGLPLVSRGFESGRSRLCELHSRSCISKVEKEILSLTTPASGMKALAHIGAWHNSLDRMAAVILVSPLLNYFYITNVL